MKRTDEPMLEGLIIPSHLAITAMRDSGYKNTAYALAELIDNAQEAKASHIEVLCLEKKEKVNRRIRRRLNRIAVLDDGVGMDSVTLRNALQFGNGTHLKDRTGIGRFGMGLPNASISQADKVEIWSWENGPDNALFTYLDVEQIEQGAMNHVPEPIRKPVPEEWREIAENLDKTGTLVVWSNVNIDRLTWKTAKPTLENVEYIVGRIYRRFFIKNSLDIRLFAKDEDDGEIIFDGIARITSLS